VPDSVRHPEGSFGGRAVCLHAATTIQGMSLPSFRLHALQGGLRGYWAVTVRANWRIIFRFQDGAALGVDFVD
jgi:proteic killer suppression protein